MYKTSKIKEFVHEFMDTMAEDFRLERWPYKKPNDDEFFQDLLKDIDDGKKILLTVGIGDGSLNKVYIEKSFKDYYERFSEDLDEFDLVLSLFTKKDCPHQFSSVFVKFGKKKDLFCKDKERIIYSTEKAKDTLEQFFHNVIQHYKMNTMIPRFEDNDIQEFFENITSNKRTIYEFDAEVQEVNIFFPKKSYAEYNPSFKKDLDKQAVMLIFYPKDEVNEPAYMTMYDIKDFL